jgi:hypothetical protein
VSQKIVDDTDKIKIGPSECMAHSGVIVEIKNLKGDQASMWAEINGLKKAQLTALVFVIAQCLAIIGALVAKVL